MRDEDNIQTITPFTIFTDCSKSDQGVGYAFQAKETTISRRISRLASNFAAEIMAVGDEITYAVTNSSNDTVTITIDSKSVMLAEASINNRIPLVQALRENLHKYGKQVMLWWIPDNVGLPRNVRVDEASKAGVTGLEISFTELPASDIKIYFKESTFECWKSRWQNATENKFRNIKNTALPFSLATLIVHGRLHYFASE